MSFICEGPNRGRGQVLDGEQLYRVDILNCKRVKQSKKTNNKGFDAINVSRYCLLYCVLLLLLLVLLLGNLFLGIWNSGV